ncbi:MAG: response regulator transcription factor, partial [Myxococcota bacterium]
RSMLRRQRWSGAEGGLASGVFRFGEAEIDFDRHLASAAGRSVSLTRLELDLLRYFVENQERVLTRDELLEKVWKLSNYSTARTVDNFISRLRRHFEEDPQRPKHFLSVRGRGYKFVM